MSDDSVDFNVRQAKRMVLGAEPDSAHSLPVFGTMPIEHEQHAASLPVPLRPGQSIAYILQNQVRCAVMNSSGSGVYTGSCKGKGKGIGASSIGKGEGIGFNSIGSHGSDCEVGPGSDVDIGISGKGSSGKGSSSSGCADSGITSIGNDEGNGIGNDEGNDEDEGNLPELLHWHHVWNQCVANSVFFGHQNR